MSESDVDGISQLSTNREPSVVLELPESEREMIATVRETLDLPEASPLLTDAYATKRNLAVAQFVRDGEASVLADKIGFVDRNEAEFQKNNYHPVPLTAIDRFYLKVKGVSEDDVVFLRNFFESYIPNTHLIDILGRNTLKTHVLGLRNQLAQVNSEPSALMRRMSRMGISGAITRCFEDPTFISGVAEIAKVPDGIFEEIMTELNPHSYIQQHLVDYHDDGTSNISPVFETMVQVMKNRGFTPEQKVLLEKAKRNFYISRRIQTIHNGEPSLEINGTLRDVFAAKDTDVDDVMEAVEDVWYIAQQKYDRRDRIHPESILKGFSSLSPESRRILRSYIKNGYDCAPIYQLLDSYSDLTPEQVDKAEKMIQGAHVFLEDPVAKSWSLLFQDIEGKMQMDIFNSENYDSVLQNRQEVYDKRKELYDSVNFIKSLAFVGEENKPNLRRALSILEGKRTDGAKSTRAQVDTDYLYRWMESYAQAHQGSNEAYILLTMSDYFFKDSQSAVYGRSRTILPEDLPVMTYLIEQRDHYKELLLYGSAASSLLVTKILNGEIEVPEERKKYWLNNVYDIQNMDPDLLAKHMDYLEPRLFIISAQKMGDTIDTSKISEHYRPAFTFFQSLDNKLASRVSSYRGDVTDLYENGRPSLLFFKEVTKSEGKSGLLDSFLTDEVIAQKGYSIEEKNVLTLLRNMPEGSIGPRILFDDRFKTRELVTEKGQPTELFFDIAIRQGTYTLAEIYPLLTPDAIADFSPNAQIFWETYKKSDEIVQRFLVTHHQSIVDHIEKDPAFVNKLDQYIVAMREIAASPVPEIKRLKDQLISILMETTDPAYELTRITEIFTKNHLPTTGKVLEVFKLLYPPDAITTQLSKSKLSPVLTEANPARYMQILYPDVLKVFIDSANPQLRTYLAAMQEAGGIFEKALAGQPLSPTEQEQAHSALAKLNTLIAASPYGKARGVRVENNRDIAESLQLLSRDLGVSEGQTITSRIERMFLGPVGITDSETALSRMSDKVEEAHHRGVVLGTHLLEEDARVALHRGDCIKGIGANGTQYLGATLRNGILSKEFLGASATSDSTPFGTDVGVVSEEDEEAGFTQAYNNSPATEYGNLALVIKSRGQFQQTSLGDESVRYDKSAYEIYQTGVKGNRHFDIRSGIASTEIDYFIARELVLSSELEKGFIYFTIAQNGWYIPVVTEEGKSVFSEDDYDYYQLDRNRVRQLLTNPDVTPADYMARLSQNPFLDKLYQANSGVSENYTIEEHTGMVLGQFDRLHPDLKATDVVDDGLFKMILAVHDIGAPLAVQMGGTRAKQHEYTQYMVESMCDRLEIPSRDRDLIIMVTSQDILGNYMKGTKTSEQTAGAIKMYAQGLSIEPAHLYRILRAYYASDASAYTSLASYTDRRGTVRNGEASAVEPLFIIDGETDTVRFSDDATNKLTEVEVKF